MPAGRPTIEECTHVLLKEVKPFKLSKTQKEFIKMIEKNPNRKLIIATRGQLSRMRR
jgi:hypothetical protein